MIYTVVWIGSALDELADVWNNASDRKDVSAASNAIDAQLRSNPHSNSELREGALQIMFVSPLAVLFDVSDADRLVTVRAVWRPF